MTKDLIVFLLKMLAIGAQIWGFTNGVIVPLHAVFALICLWLAFVIRDWK